MSIYVHESSFIDKDAAIGEGSKIGHFCHIQFGAVIGKSCTIGQNVYIENGVKIGDGCTIQNNVSLYTGVELEDYVFCGPSCVFINELTPRCQYPKESDYFGKTLVKKGASIGANATILCGRTIGSYAMVGAGAVVTKNVDDHTVVIGVPARKIEWVCECGELVARNFVCNNCRRHVL